MANCAKIVTKYSFIHLYTNKWKVSYLKPHLRVSANFSDNLGTYISAAFGARRRLNNGLFEVHVVAIKLDENAQTLFCMIWFLFWNVLQNTDMNIS